MLDHVFFDARMSSHDPAKAEILDVAAIRTNRKGDVLASMTNRVFPQGGVDADAAKTCDYDGDVWHREAVPYRAAVETFRSVIRAERFDEQFIVVAHFADRFPIEVKTLFIGAAWIDLAVLAWPHFHHGLIPSRGLSTLSKHVGVKAEKLTTAAGGAFAVMRVYWEIMRRCKTALQGEEFLRNAGGDTLESIRKRLGF